MDATEQANAPVSTSMMVEVQIPVAATPWMKPALQDLPKSDLEQVWRMEDLGLRVAVGAEMVRVRKGRRLMSERCIVIEGCERMWMKSGMKDFGSGGKTENC